MPGQVLGEGAGPVGDDAVADLASGDLKNRESHRFLVTQASGEGWTCSVWQRILMASAKARRSPSLT